MKALLIDTSGSVYLPIVESHISAIDADVYIFFHTKPYKILYCKADALSAILHNYEPGGTVFGPAILKALQLGATQITMVTDGDGPDWPREDMVDTGIMKFILIDP